MKSEQRALAIGAWETTRATTVFYYNRFVALFLCSVVYMYFLITIQNSARYVA